MTDGLALLILLACAITPVCWLGLLIYEIENRNR